VESLRVDDELGLMGLFRFTDKGAEAAKFRRYRFVSPVWNTDGEDRPTKLLRVGLTNRPQIPVKPLINSVRKHNPPEGVPETIKENPNMEKSSGAPRKLLFKAILFPFLKLFPFSTPKTVSGCLLLEPLDGPPD
jgi:hypothetical protein